MLNELFQIAEALDRLKLSGQEAHPSIKPIGNSPLLIARLTELGRIGSLDILMPEQAGLLKRVEHGAAGTSFPGFNVPSPVWNVADVPVEHLKQLIEVQKNRNATPRQRLGCLCALKPFVKLRAFTPEQERQFNRVLGEFPKLLAADFDSAPAELATFTRLLAVLGKTKPDMPDFVSQLAEQVTRSDRDVDLPFTKAVESFLVGQVAFRGVELVGGAEWWKKKTTEDTKGKTAVFVDLHDASGLGRAVAHRATCDLIETHLLKVRPGRGYATGGKGAKRQEGIDAFSGEEADLTTSFPEPRVQALRPPDLKLFSASSESPCLGRYALIESAIFPASKKNSARMQDAILHLAKSKEQRGKTWYPIPSNLNEKKKPKTDLLVAYLENEPESQAALAEMFGGQCETFSDADFEARTQPVFEALEAKLKTMPDMNVRLLVLSSIDRGRKQISLNRSMRVAALVRSAKEWQAGAHNVPDVCAGLYDKNTKQPILRTTPCPLDLASTVNRVWSADAKTGFRPSYQRAMSSADAYDVFMADSPLARQKAQDALRLLVGRMSVVLIALGAVRTTGEWTGLSDVVRWQSVKSIALIGIILHQIGKQKDTIMNEPTYHVGRLLALTDSLHFQYCKFVRTSEENRKAGKVGAPSELVGNALFNYALDQPVSALARLAERIKPYKGWADTYSGEDAGLIHWLVRQMAETQKGIDVSQLPPRMGDAEKAQLLLGYLADHSKNETPKQ